VLPSLNVQVPGQVAGQEDLGGPQEGDAVRSQRKTIQATTFSWMTERQNISNSVTFKHILFLSPGGDEAGDPQLGPVQPQPGCLHDQQLKI
jgi:hypothetical protein